MLGRVALGVAALRVRPSWPEGAGGVAGKVSHTCLEGRPGLLCFTGGRLLGGKVVTIPSLFSWWVSRWKLGKREGEGAWAGIGEVANDPQLGSDSHQFQFCGEEGPVEVIRGPEHTPRHG